MSDRERAPHDKPEEREDDLELREEDTDAVTGGLGGVKIKGESTSSGHEDWIEVL